MIARPDGRAKRNPESRPRGGESDKAQQRGRLSGFRLGEGLGIPIAAMLAERDRGLPRARPWPDSEKFACIRRYIGRHQEERPDERGA